MNNCYCVIMAGGIGSRFWPLSKEEKPKQFIDILGIGRTFIQQTFDRFRSFVPLENFLIVTSDRYKDLVLEQLPELSSEQVLCEPMRRNTAPCIAYAAYRIAAKDKNAVMVVTPSDHLVTNQPLFQREVTRAMEFASSRDALMTIGITPSRPETGYGYIQVGEQETETGIARVKTFTEKPNSETAKLFVESGEFFWNSGIFIWNLPSIMRALQQYAPEIVTAFEKGIGTYNTPQEDAFINKVYSECSNISIDYAVMEKAKNVYVNCSGTDLGWSDVGTWGSLYANSEKDEHGNVRSNSSVVSLHQTEGSIVKLPEGKRAIIDGLQGYIVVDSEDALLIYRKDREQEIRSFVEKIQ